MVYDLDLAPFSGRVGKIQQSTKVNVIDDGNIIKMKTFFTGTRLSNSWIFFT